MTTEELYEKHVDESIRQDNTTWVIQDLIKIIRKLTNDKSIHDKLDKVLSDVMKGC